MATSKAWRELIRQQQEKLVTTEKTTSEVPAAPGVCACGYNKFRLVYIDRKLHRICRSCEKDIIV